jgi:hypothetical protein
LEIVKTAVLLDVNVVGTATLVLLAFRADAVNCRVAPMSTEALVAGVILTDAGGRAGTKAPLLLQPVMPNSNVSATTQAKKNQLHRTMHPPRSHVLAGASASCSGKFVV